MDIVLPLLASGAARDLRLPRPTLERFYRDLSTTWVYSRPDEVAAVERATRGLDGVHVRADVDLVPELTVARAAPRDAPRARGQRRQGRDPPTPRAGPHPPGVCRVGRRRARDGTARLRRRSDPRGARARR